MHPVQTAVEKDLCLVAPVWPLTFLPHLVCALSDALLDTLLMKTVCVKVSSFSTCIYYIFTVLYCIIVFKLTVCNFSLSISLSLRVCVCARVCFTECDPQCWSCEMAGVCTSCRDPAKVLLFGECQYESCAQQYYLNTTTHTCRGEIVDTVLLCWCVVFSSTAL